jgi:hypothetical protein
LSTREVAVDHDQEWRVQVSFASRRSPDKSVNDDLVIAIPSVVVVLDGASVPPGLETGCRHGTSWFVHQLGRRLLSLIVEESTAPLAEPLSHAIEQTRALHDGTCDLEHPETPSATVAIARERDAVLDYLVLGDSTVLLDGLDEVHAVSDTRIDGVAATHRAAIHEHLTGSADGHRSWADYTVQLRQYRNRSQGFWVASTDPEAAHRAVTGTVACDGLRRAALLTDGATRMVDLFQLLDWDGLLELLERTGPEGLIRRTRAAETSDPMGRRWPRSKRHDDATAVLCRFNEV